MIQLPLTLAQTEEDEGGSILDPMLDILKDFADWVWCWLVGLIYDATNLLLDAVFVFVPELGADPNYVSAINELFTYLTALQNFFPLAEFVVVFGVVKSLEIGVWAFKVIITMIPGASH